MGANIGDCRGEGRFGSGALGAKEAVHVRPLEGSWRVEGLRQR
jgi:hypothetical protein